MPSAPETESLERARQRRDGDDSRASGVYAREREASRGLRFVDEARRSPAGSDEERRLADRLEQLDDLHESLGAFRDIGTNLSRLAGGGKLMGFLLSGALLGAPVVERWLSPHSQVEEKLEAIAEELAEARRERTSLTVWLFALELCKTDPSACPDGPPASVRMTVAADEMARDSF